MNRYRHRRCGALPSWVTNRVDKAVGADKAVIWHIAYHAVAVDNRAAMGRGSRSGDPQRLAPGLAVIGENVDI